MKEILKKAEKIKEVIVADRRYLHQNPEVGNDLPVTVAYVKKRLTEMGYQPQEVSKSGVSALAGGKKGGKTVLLRGDMDALPMREDSGLPFQSEIEAAHTCGHDMHTAMLLGAAALLKQMENELNGSVKLMFQPAEELLLGAKAMIDAGILDNPKVDAAFAIHVAADRGVGEFGYDREYTHSSSDSFHIDIKGKGSHGAMPHMGIDPINVAAHIHIALQEILAREISAAESAIVTIGQLTAGNATNIIPESAHMKGTVRAYSAPVRELALRRLREISENIGRAFNAEVVLTFPASAPSVFNDGETVDFMLDVLKEGGFALQKRRSMGSEDFAFVAERVPSAFLALGAGTADKSRRVALHNPQVLLDEDALPIGAAVYAALAKKWLERNGDL